MKAYVGVDVYSHIFLASALVGGEWSGSHPGHFTPRQRAPGTHWIEGSVDPRSGLDDVEKRTTLTLLGLELLRLDRPACSQSLYRLRYPGYREMGRLRYKPGSQIRLKALEKLRIFLCVLLVTVFPAPAQFCS
jgi:hypothetical protein